jgi:hypothetical protein
MYYFRKTIVSHVVLSLLVVGASFTSGCTNFDKEKDEPTNNETSFDQVTSTDVEEKPDSRPDVDSEPSPAAESWKPGAPISQPTPAQLSGMGKDRIQLIPPRDISNMSIDQLRAIYSQYLTKEQIGAITYEQFSASQLSKSQYIYRGSNLHHLSPRVMSQLALNEVSDFPLLSLFYFSKDQLEAVNSWSDNQLMSFRGYDIYQTESESLKTAPKVLHEILQKICILSIKNDKSSISQKFERGYFSYLTPAQISELPIHLIEVINYRFFGSDLSEEQLSALTDEQLSAFPRKIRDSLNIPWQSGDPVSRLTPAQLSRMGEDKIQLIPSRDISNMSIDQFRAIYFRYLTKEQIGAITYEQFSASQLSKSQYIYRESKLYHLSPQVISQLAVNEVSDFPLLSLFYFSKDQLEAVNSWSDDQLMSFRDYYIFYQTKSDFLNAPKVLHEILQKIYVLLKQNSKQVEASNLEGNYFPRLTPSQISKLPLHLIREVNSPLFIDLLSREQLSAFTQEQLNSFQLLIREKILERLFGPKQSGPKPSESSSHSGFKSDMPKFKSEPREGPKMAICKFLGIDPKSSTFESIKKEYKKFALKHHPDKAPGSDNEEKMKNLNMLFDNYKDSIN